MTSPSFDRPFPALTPAQRYHLDVLGYVVVQNTLSSDEVEKIAAALYRLRGELAQLQDPTAAGPRCAARIFCAINRTTPSWPTSSKSTARSLLMPPTRAWYPWPRR